MLFTKKRSVLSLFFKTFHVLWDFSAIVRFWQWIQHQPTERIYIHHCYDKQKKAFLAWKPICLLWGMLDYYIHIWLPPLVFCRCREPFCWVLPYKHFPRFCERTIHTCWKRCIWWTIPWWTWPETIPNYSCGKDISWDHTFFHPSRVW